MADDVSDYSHRFHAGNHGDVWKHVALLATLDALPAGTTVLDTHAGEGGYKLGGTGEWTEGVGKLYGGVAEPVPDAVRRYLERLKTLTGGDRRRYPGSPRLVLSGLPKGGRSVSCELQADAANVLRDVLRTEPRGKDATVVAGDGYATLATFDADPGFVLIDPPFTRREEWTDAPDQIAKAWKRAPKLRFLLWYPIKSFVRPNVLQARLRDQGVPAVAIDLVVTPLDVKRNALNGSGVLWVNAPPGVTASVSAATTALGPLLATHDGRWSVRTTAW